MPIWSGPTTNLTHRWQMDAGSISGTTVSDLAGALNGTLSATGVSAVASPANAFASTALAFDGASGLMNLASSPIAFTGAGGESGPWTIAFWANLPDITFTPSGGTFSSFFNFTNASDYMTMGNGNPFSLPGQACVNDLAGAAGNAASAVWTNNLWAHLATTYDGANYLFYVNSVLVGTSSGNVLGGSLAGNQIAARGDTTHWLKASLYQFVTYSAVLAQNQITQLYQADNIVPATGFSTFDLEF